MNLFEKLFGKKKTASAAPKEPEVQPSPEPTPPKPPYLTETVTFGMHPYRRADEDSSVYFVDEVRGIRKMLVDPQGNIQNFPGVVREEFWTKHVPQRYLQQQVRFRSDFEKWDSGWIFKWQLQPDGWYWADEGGFGGEDDLEVVLYTFVDQSGDFTGPFRLYRLGSRGYALERFRQYHAQSQRRALEAVLDEERHPVFPADLLPQLWGCREEYQGDYFYQLKDRQEVLAYWDDPVLSRDLKDLAQALADSEKSLWAIMGKASHRLKGCMTLFYAVTKEPVFQLVLDKRFGGQMDETTLHWLEQEN